MMTRRQAIKSTVLAAAASGTVLSSAKAGMPSPVPGAGAPGGPFKLVPMPYAYDALEPYIDARTMEIHYTKHHQGYVNNLNTAVLRDPSLASRTVEELLRNLSSLPDTVRTAVQNNAGGDYNHTLFWDMMKKGGGGQPKGELAAAIDKKWGSYREFEAGFILAATSRFGSGWAWLTIDKNKELGLTSTANQDTPISTPGMNVLLGIDVWEHAYYLKHQNVRADYVTAFLNVINWDYVAGRYHGFAA